MTPHLPKGWNEMELKNIHAFQNVFDLEIQRIGKNKLAIIVVKNGNKKKYIVKEGDTKRIQFS
jgi:hypothetical protein